MSEELRALKEELRSLASDVRERKIEPNIAVAVNQLLNTVLRAMGEERKAKELDELEARIEAREGKDL